MEDKSKEGREKKKEERRKGIAGLQHPVSAHNYHQSHNQKQKQKLNKIFQQLQHSA